MKSLNFVIFVVIFGVVQIQGQPDVGTGTGQGTGTSNTGTGTGTNTGQGTGSNTGTGTNTGTGGSQQQSGGQTTTEITNPEVTLVNEILDAYPYPTLSRPAFPGETINVTISITINNFDGIDDLRQIMSFSGIITMKWPDTYINWEPEQRSSIQVVHLRHKDVWLPLIIQSSDPGEMKPIIYAEDNQNSDRLWVYNNGTIVAARADNFATKCILDLSTFPV